MYRLSEFLLSLLATIFLLSCSKDDSSNVESVAQSFATKYFNWDYAGCMQYVAGESAEYMKFRATNVTDGDIELLRSMDAGAEVEVKDCDFADGDSTAQVTVKVTNFCYADTIGRPAKLCEEAEAVLQLVKRNEKWQVTVSSDWPRMAFPQQSGMPGRDLDEGAAKESAHGWFHKRD